MENNSDAPEFLQSGVTSEDIQTLIKNESINTRLAVIVLERRLASAIQYIENLEGQLKEST